MFNERSSNKTRVNLKENETAVLVEKAMSDITTLIDEGGIEIELAFREILAHYQFTEQEILRLRLLVKKDLQRREAKRKNWKPSY